MLTSFEVIEHSGVQFGTSGARGLVDDFTPAVCQAFTHAFLACMESEFAVARVLVGVDNRPSSDAIAKACAAAVRARGYRVIFAGVLPTPALAYSAMQKNMPAIMVTGSHIPFDRNGLKFYRPNGEISKQDEQRILNSHTEFSVLPSVPRLALDVSAASRYAKRYLAFFPSDLLAGKRIGIYEHSSAGRDVYAPLFRELGATVISLDRTNEFTPIDTEAIREIDQIKARAWQQQHQLDAIFSSDGDGDRPLVADERGEWLRGDILGLLCANALGIEAIALPISCNSLIHEAKQFKQVLSTKIGSPYVIEAMQSLSQTYSSVAGFEANGGFMLGTAIAQNGKTLTALPTRDALLPFLMLMSAAKTTPISQLVASLPKRFTHSDRVKNLAIEKSHALLNHGQDNPEQLLQRIGVGNTKVANIDLTDGLRLSLSDSSVIHLRPSGNAPELRCYTEAASPKEAKTLAEQVLSHIEKMT